MNRTMPLYLRFDFFSIGKEVVGMSRASHNSAQSIGCIIPVSVINHLLDDIRLHNSYTAFPRMAFRYEFMENLSCRKYFE